MTTETEFTNTNPVNGHEQAAPPELMRYIEAMQAVSDATMQQLAIEKTVNIAELCAQLNAQAIQLAALLDVLAGAEAFTREAHWRRSAERAQLFADMLKGPRIMVAGSTNRQ